MDDATLAYAFDAMDNLQRAGVKIRLFHLAATFKNPKDALRKAIEDELNGVPLP